MYEATLIQQISVATSICYTNLSNYETIAWLIAVSQLAS